MTDTKLVPSKEQTEAARKLHDDMIGSSAQLEIIAQFLCDRDAKIMGMWREEMKRIADTLSPAPSESKPIPTSSCCDAVMVNPGWCPCCDHSCKPRVP